MSRLVSLLTAAVCVQFLALAAVPLAQNQQPRQGGQQFQMNTDRMVERLNRDLNLSADQQKKIKTIYEKAFSPAQSGNNGATGAAARRQRMTQQNNAQNDFQKRFEQMNAEIKKVLTPEQQKKYDAMPRMGANRGGNAGRGANIDDRIARLDERLKLSADQKKKLKTVLEKQNQDMQKMFEKMREQGGDQQATRDSMRETMTKQGEKNQKEIEAVFSAEQQKQYRAMQEELAQQRRQRPQGGGNNQQRQPQGGNTQQR